MLAHPPKTIIVGGGIIGALTAYYTYLAARAKGEQARVTIYDKNKNLSETTAYNIVPSLSDTEITCVVPPVPVLRAKLNVLFSEPDGLRVDDVKGVHDSKVTHDFLKTMEQYSKDKASQLAQTKALLELGKISMQLWQEMYDTADSELKQIMEESNFNSCREPRKTEKTLLDGYRIDLIYKVKNAKAEAKRMKNNCEGLGYKNCKILSPDEVKALDPSLTDFCDTYSEIDKKSKERCWKKGAIAVWRPGGCIDAQVFLPKFYAYLSKIMGQYTDKDGQRKECFKIKFGHEVEEVICNRATSKNPGIQISSLNFVGLDTQNNNTRDNETSNYIICPGEAVGTLTKLGFAEPSYAGFSGASLKLTIPLSKENLSKYANFNHCMEVYQEGVVLAWQARIKNGKLFIGVAGTKAFYGDQTPDKDHAFALNRNLLQLNMINDVLPRFISLALDRNTKDSRLTEKDLIELERLGMAERWVGRRAVAADGFLTVDHAKVKIHPSDEASLEKNAIHSRIENAIVLTHFGSGGCAIGPAGAVLGLYLLSGQCMNDKFNSKLVEDVLRMADSTR